MINLEQVNIQPVAEDATLVAWPDVIAPAIAEQIHATQQFLKEQLGDKIIEAVASYSSLLIYYRFDLISFEQLNTLLLKQLSTVSNQNMAFANAGIVNIPVYYAGWDLEYVSKQTGLSINDVIDMHSKHYYTAYAHGFVPGFCYLASIDKQLQLPRIATPRQQVPEGAVAIANEQTAIYPASTPGGWHILGFTPKKLFTIEKQQFIPTIALGQKVKFSPISHQAFIELGGKIYKEC